MKYNDSAEVDREFDVGDSNCEKINYKKRNLQRRAEYLACLGQALASNSSLTRF